MRTISDDMPARGRPVVPASVITRMIEMRRAGASIQQIADATAVAKSAVHRHVASVKRDNRLLPAPAPEWLGEAQAMLRAGMTANQIAKALGLHSSRVYRVLEKFSA